MLWFNRAACLALRQGESASAEVYYLMTPERGKAGISKRHGAQGPSDLESSESAVARGSGEGGTAVND